jgi:predicted acetyltransferase
MPPEIRRVEPADVPAWLEAITTTFLDRPDVATMAGQVTEYWDFERVWGAFDGKVVGTLRTWATELTVPGGAHVPASAVSAVTVLPTHRRRGVLRSMISAEHDAARDRGEVLGLLYASEAPIYGRFGYGTGVTGCGWTIDRLATSIEGPAVTGVDFAPIDEATRDLIRGVFDRYRLARLGEIRRRDFTFGLDLALISFAWETPWKGWVIVHRDAAGAPDGFARYGAETRWENRQPRSVLNVQDLVALNDDAYDALWRFLLEVDLVAAVKVDRCTLDERLPWRLTNRRAAIASEVGDGMWVALLDVPRALEARAYERTDELVLEVVEPEPRSGSRRLRLEAGPDGVRCTPTRKAPDLVLHADALGAAYLGGTSLRNAVLARGCTEGRPGALARADALFRTLATPRCSTFF